MDATFSLPDLLAEIPDPRPAEAKRHPLPAVLSLVVLATMAGMRALQGVVDFGRNLPPDVIAALGFTRSKTLAKSTLSEILRAIDITSFEAVVSRWRQRQADRCGWTAIAIDGKANGCDYCLAAHSTIGRMVGLTDDQIRDRRHGSAVDPKDDALIRFARRVVETRGQVDDADLEDVRRAGFGDGAIAEVVANVALHVLTNYFNVVARTDIDFPAAPALAPAVIA